MENNNESVTVYNSKTRKDETYYPIENKKCDCDKCHVEKINNLFKQINDITAMYIDQIQTRENRLVVESLVEEIKMAINKTM